MRVLKRLESELPAAWEVVLQGIDAGLHRGVQVLVWHRGQTIVDDAIGEAKPGVAMGQETINLWMSATKPLVAIALAQVWERGELRLDDPVSRFIPEFAVHGKDKVTIEHLLTHTSGLPREDVGPASSWDELIARIAALPPEEEVPGSVAAYQPLNTWAILGEIVRRIDGRMIDTYLEDELFRPLDMASWSLGIPPEGQRAKTDRIGWIYQRRPGDKHLVPADYYNSEAGVSAIRPASNGRGTSRELSHFYQMLLAGGQWGGKQIIRKETVRQFTSPVRIGMVDQTFRHPIDWSLGFIVNSQNELAETMPYGFGLHASDKAFGHGGRESSTAFADPVHELVIAVFFNGMPGEGRHQQRMRSFLTAVYEELGLTSKTVDNRGDAD